MNYELNGKYLNSQPIKSNPNGVRCVVIGGVLFAIGQIVSSIIEELSLIGILVTLIGGVLLAIALYILCTNKEVYVTDAEYDASVRSQINDIKMQALNALGVDESEVAEIEPIYFDGYTFNNASKIKKGKDGCYRSNIFHFVYILFSANEAHIYKYYFNTLENWCNEETEVYFYRDIVTVSTNMDTLEIAGQKISINNIKLTTAGGTVFAESIIDVGNAQRSINAMRALLREKKQTQL